MKNVPNKQTIPAATTVSLSLAFICEEIAITAAAPQIAVPHAIKIVNLLLIFKSLPIK